MTDRGATKKSAKSSVGAASSTLGQRIRQARGTLSQPEFATKLGVHFNTVSRHERDAHNVPADLLIKICHEFEVEPRWLLLGQGPMQRGAGGAGAPDLRRLRDVVRAIEDYLGSERLVLRPEKKADLIVTLYELVAAEKERNAGAPVDLSRYRNVIRLAR